MPSRPPLVLDTHVWIWVAEGQAERLAAPVIHEIGIASQEGRLHVSAISSWEVAMLVQKGRLTLAQDVRDWVAATRKPPGVLIAPITSEIAIDSAELPAFAHGHPADRLITSTARALSAELVTCDEVLLRYGATGHVRTVDARP